jgi:integrase
MSAFKKGGRATYMVKIFDRRKGTKGEWVQRGIRTKDSVTAKRMQTMIDAIGAQGSRAWQIVDALVDQVITVPHVYDIYLEESRDLDRVKVRLEDVDLEPYVKQWLKNPGGKVKRDSDSAQHYEYSVRQFVPKKTRFPLSRFTSHAIQQHLEELTSSAATRRKAGAAIASFGRWLYRRNVIRTKPMRDVELPAAAGPRDKWLETADAIRLAEAQEPPYRQLSALLAGSGIEVSVALSLRKRDVDMKTKEIHAAGTKAHSRNRIVRVADWAWPYVEQMAKGLMADAKLFEEIPDRWRAAVHHDEAIYGYAVSQRRDESKGLVAEFPVYRGYTMRDARHTWAVRAVKSGMPLHMVSEQLGHANGTLVLKVYGRYAPRKEERDRWEKIASAQDAERTQQAREEEK